MSDQLLFLVIVTLIESQLQCLWCWSKLSSGHTVLTPDKNTGER